MIAVCATGLDRVDLEYCREKGIVVSNVRDYAGSTVAEHVLLLMLSLSRNFLPYIKDVEDGEWSRTKSFCLLDHPIRELRGKTLGIIGYGKLGIAVERVVLALGINVLIAEHKGAAEVRDGRTEFDEVLKRSDFLSLHTPLTEETRGMIGRREFNLMKPSALFINCARGGVMDENALVEALKAGKIGGAGIDVLHREPPPSDHPLLNLRNQNLIVTPHIAWASKEAMQALADQVIDNIEAFYRGQPRNVVT
jgi:glycerate dehydrogenase